MKRHRTQSAITFALVLLLALGVGMGTSHGADKATFTMNFVINGTHAGFIAGMDRGDYKAAGIDVDIKRGFGAADTVTRVAAGQTEFGVGDIAGSVVARSKDAKVKTVAIMHDKAQIVLFVFKDSGIRHPKDLEGKTIAIVPRDIVQDLFPVVAKRNGVDESKVKWLGVNPAAIIPSWLAGTADAAAAFAPQRPVAEDGAKKLGKEVSGIYYADWGADIYSLGIMTQDERIARNPDLVRRFVGASLKGFAWAIENPDQAIDILVKHHPATNRDIDRRMFNVGLELALTPRTTQNGLGYISEEKMTFTRDTIVKNLNLPVNVPVKDLYSSEFLPKPMFFPKRKM